MIAVYFISRFLPDFFAIFLFFCSSSVTVDYQLLKFQLPEIFADSLPELLFFAHTVLNMIKGFQD